MLTYLVKEVDQLVRASAWYQMDVSQCEACGRSPGDVMQLESELHLTQEAADRLQRNLAEKTEEAKRREEEATGFKNQVSSSLHLPCLPELSSGFSVTLTRALPSSIHG